MSVPTRLFELENFRVTSNGGGSSYPLSLKDASLTFDRGWAPYVQANFTVVQPAKATVTAVSPTANMRVKGTMRQTVGTSVTTRSFDLGLRSRQLQWTSHEMTLGAASDEALAMDYGNQLQRSGTGAGDTQLMIQQAMNDLGYDCTFDPGFPNVDVSPRTWDGGVTAWEYAADAAEMAGAWLWCNELRVWRCSTPQQQVGDEVRRLTDSDLVIDVVDETSRDDDSWGNHAVLVYGQTDEGQYTYYAGSGSSAAGRKSLVLQRKTRKGASGAQGVVTRAMKKGRNLSVTAVLDITVRPNEVWEVTYGDEVRTGKVSRVQMNLKEGTMLMNLDDVT